MSFYFLYQGFFHLTHYGNFLLKPCLCVGFRRQRQFWPKSDPFKFDLAYFGPDCENTPGYLEPWGGR